MNQHFSHSGMEVILNIQYSKIGFGYPRIFFKAGEKYNNLDLTLGHVFPMTKEDWNSWFDEELEELTTSDEIATALQDFVLDVDNFLTELAKIAQAEGLT